MRRHTLFLLQGKEVQWTTVDRLVEWSAAGLLHPVSFLDLETLGSANGAADAEHRVLDRGELSEPTSLLSWLADHFCDVMQLVTLHTASARGEEREGVIAAERLRSGLETWLGDQQRVVALACFLVDPNETTLHLDSVLETWSANLVISPTDQALPVGTAAPVAAHLASGEANSSFADIAAQNLCTIGGAWRFLASGPLDDLRQTSYAGGVQVVRTFVRTLDLEDPTDQVIEEALQRSGGTGVPGWPVPSSGVPLVPAFPPGRASAEAADQICGQFADTVDLVRMQPAAPRARTKLGLWAALKMFLRYLVQGARSAPRVALDTAVMRASNAASTAMTRVIFGNASEFEVTVGRPRQRPISDPEVLQHTLLKAVQISDPNAAFMPPSTRDLWHDYLQVGVALVDGSAMPPSHTRPQVGDARAVLTDPADVVVAADYPQIVIPGKVVNERADIELDAGDPLRVCLQLDLLKLKLASLTETSDDGAAAPNGQPPENLGKPGAASGVPNPPAGPSVELDPETPGPDGGETVDPVAEQRGKEIEEVQRHLGLLEEWIRETREPYTWQVGMRIARSVEESERLLLQATSELESATRPPPPVDGISRKRVFTPIGIGVAALACCIGLAIWGAISWNVAVPVGVGALLLGVLVGFVNYVRDARREFRLVHAYRESFERLEEAARAFRHYAQETLRLSSVYWQYKQWTPIIAGLLHDPFAGTYERPAQGTPMIVRDSSRGTRSGVAVPDPARLESLTHDARRRIFTTGWALRCWEAAHSYLEADYRQRRALDTVLDPYDENLRRRTGFLEYLSQGFSVGAHGPPCRDLPRSTTRDLVTSSPLGSLTSSLRVNGEHEYPDAAASADADPVEGLFHEILPSKGERRFAAGLWRSGGLTAPVDVYTRIIAIPPGWRDRVPADEGYLDTTPVQHNGQLLFASARVDLSEPCDPAELTVFEDQPTPSAQPSQPAYEPDDEGD